ncbi:enoyl-CoA hydratase [Siccirubricoccus deserti]|uniref:Enoyl-CoA hydratase/isomerase family protein n=1 Tax=Siccirubricoccus deserti TaxID=2013562 RepID=A0A9X0QZX3_9PROT|nr:enoyl-CoA hydratase/isomerase family protein [Siccirubricoccus deserti]MBC4017086.1 enoyl-CoA hydratase/isomerase family protein [Siccirubricoccus deserti]GGC56270.1 enoyl-CoA hydratase [Siccirubricoccus deserti]
MSAEIEIIRHDGWAQIRVNREAQRNAMNRATRQGLMAAFEELRGKARAIILTGTGVAFCAGMDLKEREQDRQAGIEGAGDEWVAVNMAIRAHPAIFIAAVNGLALGGGATLINVCDLAIASTKASIGCPEMGFSTYPGMAGPAIQLSGVTRKQAAWLVLTTNRIDGATAERWGMVNQCVEPEALLPTAQALAQKVAQFDAVALAESKKALDRIPAIITDWQEAMDHGQMVNLQIRSKTTAQAEGSARFAAGIKNPGQGV